MQKNRWKYFFQFVSSLPWSKTMIEIRFSICNSQYEKIIGVESRSAVSLYVPRSMSHVALSSSRCGSPPRSIAVDSFDRYSLSLSPPQIIRMSEKLSAKTVTNERSTQRSETQDWPIKRPANGLSKHSKFFRSRNRLANTKRFLAHVYHQF